MVECCFLMKFILSLLLGFVLLFPQNAFAGTFFTYPVRYDLLSQNYGGTYYGVIHNGIDFATDCGTPIYASNSGYISYAGWDFTGYGNRIDIINGTDTQLYAHLSYINQWSGYVTRGQYIGDVGSTGWSTGCHLHFEIHYNGYPINPMLPLTS